MLDDDSARPTRKVRQVTATAQVVPHPTLRNYSYGQVERAVLLDGLDPYAGFLHEDRPGKPSLVLDLIEEFRQLVVDRRTFALLNQRVPLAQDAATNAGQSSTCACQ
jgi:hypothetical protein